MGTLRINQIIKGLGHRTGGFHSRHGSIAIKLGRIEKLELELKVHTEKRRSGTRQLSSL